MVGGDVRRAVALAVRILVEPLGQMPADALGEPARVHEHERRAMLADQLRRAGRRPASTLRSTSPLRAASRGSSIARSRWRTWPLSTIVQSSARRRRARARRRPGTARLLRSASASPTGRRASAGGRRALRAAPATAHRCEPRFVPATAWISSTMTVRVVASISRPDCEPSRMYSDSGVVTTMCGGLRRICVRSYCGVSPVRTQVRISTSRQPVLAQLLADAGERRFEIAIDVVRQRLQRRDVDDARLVRQAPLLAFAHQLIDRGKKRGERLARARRRRDQYVFARLNRRPRVRPARASAPQSVLREPGGDGRVEVRGGVMAGCREHTPIRCDRGRTLTRPGTFLGVSQSLRNAGQYLQFSEPTCLSTCKALALPHRASGYRASLTRSALCSRRLQRRLRSPSGRKPPPSALYVASSAVAVCVSLCAS